MSSDLTRPSQRAVCELLETRKLLSIVPVGGEFHINVHTTNEQVGPRVAIDGNGNYVVVWRSLGQESAGDNGGIYLRRYSAAGAPLGGDLLVNTFTTNTQDSPAIAMDNAGNYVVAWASTGQDGIERGIYAQRFDSAGQPAGSEFRVNTFTGGDEAFPAVAMDADGDFVVAWDTANPSGSQYDVYAQRYNSGGQPVGAEFRVNSTTAGQQFSSAVAMDDAGSFVVTWIASAQDGSSYGVYARRYDSAGQPQGAEFRVNTYTTSDQAFPSISMDSDGDFVIAWQSYLQDGSEYGIYAQRFNASGAPAGGEFRVNPVMLDNQAGASVAMDSQGNFFVTWESFGQDLSFLTVMGRAFSADGTPVGGEFQINTFAVGDQQFPNVAVDPDGDAVVVWQSRQDGSENGIYGQRYRFDQIAPVVSLSDFRFQTAPHALKFTFSENVSASLSLADITVQKLPGGPAVNPVGFSYDSGTNTATFTFSGVLDDGNYRAALFATGITDAAGNPLAADHEFEFFFLLGDADHNRVVNLLDFNILAANFGQSPRDFTQADFNYDTVVNLSDFNILAARFGTSVAPPADSLPALFSSGSIRSSPKRGSGDDPLAKLLG